VLLDDLKPGADRLIQSSDHSISDAGKYRTCCAGQVAEFDTTA
jgi:hypothetical protein